MAEYQTATYQSSSAGYNSNKTIDYKSRKKCEPCTGCGYCNH